VHWHTKEGAGEQERVGENRTFHQRKEKLKREGHTSLCPDITFDTVPPVSMDLNQGFLFSEQ